LLCGHSDRHVRRGVCLQDGDTDLQPGDLAIEVAGRQGLAEQLDAVHPWLDPTLAVVARPSSPDGAVEVSRGAQGLVPSRSRAGRLSGSGVLAGRDDSGGASGGDRFVALSGIAGAVGGDAGEPLTRRHRVLRSGTTQSGPTRFGRPCTTPVVGREGTPPRTFKVRQLRIAASPKPGCRPRLPVGGGRHVISGSSQIVSDPRRFNATLQADQFVVFSFAGSKLFIPASDHAGVTQ